MDWAELQASILADPPTSGELVYLARTASQYTWCVVCDPAQPPHNTPGSALPDAWLYYGGTWPLDDPARQEPFFADLRAELESMSGGDDRCRWPLDEPWPHGH